MKETSNFDEHIQEGETSESEDNEDDLDDEEILEYGKLEDAEEIPSNRKSGKVKNIVMVERKGDYYPEIRPSIEGPDIDYNNPFGDEDFNEFNHDPNQDSSIESDDDNHMDEPKSIDEVSDQGSSTPPSLHRNRYDDGTDNYDDFDESFLNGAKSENRKYQETGEEIDFAEDELILSHVEDELNLVDEDEYLEEVCHDDIDRAEPTLLGRKNEGVSKIVNKGPRQSVSISEYHAFISQDRPFYENRFQGMSGNLGQLLTICAADRARVLRFNALSAHRAEFATADTRSHVFNFYSQEVNKKFDGKKRLGMLVTMPSTVPGTAKYQRERMMSTVTVSNKMGKPDLFITFTGNPEWSEIREECKRRDCLWADIPYLVNSVFITKLDKFLDTVLGSKMRCNKFKGKIIRAPGIYGKVVWWDFAVEFQQRGMPHVHLVIKLADPINDAGKVDEIISARVPPLPRPEDQDFEKKMIYYDLVKKLMVHFPCEKDNLAYCNLGRKSTWKKCSKGFPKEFSESTALMDDQYPRYRKTKENTFKLYRNGKEYTVGDEYVVSHTPQLLLLFGCHINVECITSIKLLKYIYKYVHKGSDRVLLQASENLRSSNLAFDAITVQGCILASRNIPPGEVRRRQMDYTSKMRAAKVDLRGDVVALNDCQYLMDYSAWTAMEAAWRNAGYPMNGSSHSVHRIYIYEENNDTLHFPQSVTYDEIGKILKQKPRGTMDAWFESNQHPVKLPNGEMSTTLTLPEMLQYFKYDVKRQKFILRKKDYSDKYFGRIQAPQPKWLELFATRLLSMNVRGPRNWTDLRTFDGIVYESCLDAAVARRLMDGEKEWENALEEIISSATPMECRRFFSSILIHSAPANPQHLWNKFKDGLVDNKKSWTPAQKESHALRHLKFLLAHDGMTLAHFQLDIYFNEKDVPFINPKNDFDNPESQDLNPSEHRAKGEEFYAKLNIEQKTVVDRALAIVDDRSGSEKMLFVDGPGGTGKTFCYNAVYHLLRAKQCQVLCVAHTGIAASLLPNGCTVHRRFSVPLSISDRMVCRISNESNEGIFLQNTDAIIWDESCSTDRRIYDAVDQLFRQLKNSNVPFGGVLFLLGGDWRQILPIVEGVRGPGVLNYILKSGPLWKHFEKYRLIRNQRALNDPEFAKFILDIGNGSNFIDKDEKYVNIPEKYLIRGNITEMIDWVFPDMSNIDACKQSALLTIDNKTSLSLNQEVLDRLDGEEHVFTSVDCPENLSIDPLILASETPIGMPPHLLKLKINSQVVLLRNLAVRLGLCNGSRMTVVKFGKDIIYCSVNSPTDNTPSTVFLHRCWMSPGENDSTSTKFKRLQYPIRLAYACTINKSQGQTFLRCGVVLHSNVFSHGQLYVAVSRVRTHDGLRIWIFKRNEKLDHYALGGILLRNVVYKDVLRDVSIKEILEKNLPIQRKDPNDQRTISPSKEMIERRKRSDENSAEKSEKTDDTSNIPITSRHSSPVPSISGIPLIIGNYLPLENSTGTRCSLNSVLNLLFHCRESREKMMENFSEDQETPLTNKLVSIFEGKASALNRVSNRFSLTSHYLRSLLPIDALRQGQNDIRQVYACLAETLDDEGTFDKFKFRTTKITRCNLGCTMKESRIYHVSSSFTIPNQITKFVQVHSARWKLKSIREKCKTCGKPILTQETWDEGKYHIVEVYHHDIKFPKFSINRNLHMFGTVCRLIGFSEYLRLAPQIGHFRTWIRIDNEWMCVDDEEMRVHTGTLNINQFMINMMLYERI